MIINLRAGFFLRTGLQSDAVRIGEWKFESSETCLLGPLDEVSSGKQFEGISKCVVS